MYIYIYVWMRVFLNKFQYLRILIKKLNGAEYEYGKFKIL